MGELCGAICCQNMFSLEINTPACLNITDNITNIVGVDEMAQVILSPIRSVWSTCFQISAQDFPIDFFLAAAVTYRIMT